MRQSCTWAIGSFALASGCLALASGCGGPTPSATPVASQATIQAAKESIAKETKLKGKTLPKDSNLSARERRALSREGQIEK